MALKHIKKRNGPILKLKNSHPAKRFLSAFMDCQTDCACQELDFDGQVPIEQEWKSSADGRVWTFSGFIYAFICFDIELDGFLQNAPELTSSETAAAQELPVMRSMMNECADAARQSGNNEIVELTDQVLEMFGLWGEYLKFRQKMIS
jgi:hypothetical protein